MVIAALAGLGIVAAAWLLLAAITFAFICRDPTGVADISDDALDAAKIATSALVLLGVIVGCIVGIAVLGNVIANQT